MSTSREMIKDESNSTKSSVLHGTIVGDMTSSYPEKMAEDASLCIKEEPLDTSFSSLPESTEQLATGPTVAASGPICVKTEPYNTTSSVLLSSHRNEDGVAAKDHSGIGVGVYLIQDKLQESRGALSSSLRASNVSLADGLALPLDSDNNATVMSGLAEVRSEDDEMPFFTERGRMREGYSADLLRVSNHETFKHGKERPWKPYKCKLGSTSLSQDLYGQAGPHKRRMPFKCDTCTAAFTRLALLKRHLVVHTGEKPYKCNLCPAEFTQAPSLKRHTQTHTGKRMHKCELCPAAFIQHTNLKRHVQTHTGEKPYKCEGCPAVFAHPTTLKYHVQTHTKEKPCKCELCPAAFGRPWSLKRHMLRHTGEKLYKCELCAAEFRYPSNLKSHLHTHTGEKPYKCKFCPAKFAQCASLKNHMPTHTGQKPFKCEFCHAAFTRSSGLKSHTLTHTLKRNTKVNTVLHDTLILGV